MNVVYGETQNKKSHSTRNSDVREITAALVKDLKSIELSYQNPASEKDVSLRDLSKIRLDPGSELFSALAEITGQGLTRSLREEWLNNMWNNDEEMLYAFDSRGNITSLQINDWVGSEWVNGWRQIYQYDGAGNTTEFLMEEWVDNAWKGLSRYLYTYDNQGNVSETTMLQWEDNAWTEFTKSYYTYNAAGQNTEVLSETTFMGFTMRSKESLFYDSRGNCTETVSESENFLTGAWENSGRNLYQYDNNNNQTEMINQSWDGTGWLNDMRRTQSYDNNYNLTGTIAQFWEGNAWLNVSNWIYTYTNLLMIESRRQIWDNNSWLDEEKSTMKYDGENRLTESLNQIYDNGSWVNDSRDTYFYGDITSVGQPDLIIPDNYILGNYPNPFNPSTKIYFSLPVESNVSLRIYDVCGNLITTLISNSSYQPGPSEIQWDGSDFNNQPVVSGVYIYILETSSKKLTGKCMLLK